MVEFAVLESALTGRLLRLIARADRFIGVMRIAQSMQRAIKDREMTQ